MPDEAVVPKRPWVLDKNAIVHVTGTLFEQPTKAQWEAVGFTVTSFGWGWDDEATEPTKPQE